MYSPDIPRHWSPGTFCILCIHKASTWCKAWWEHRFRVRLPCHPTLHTLSWEKTTTKWAQDWFEGLALLPLLDESESIDLLSEMKREKDEREIWSGERPFVFGPRLPPWVLAVGELLCGLNASSSSRLLFSYLCQQIWNKGSVAMATPFSKRINHSFPLWNLREHLTLFLA